MRSRTVSAFLGVLLCAAFVAGCETPASTTTKTISLDGGALVIQPAKVQPVIYGKQAALFDFQHSLRPGGGTQAKEIEFGYVTVKPSVALGGVTAPQRRLAWVFFYDSPLLVEAGPAPTCPAGQTVQPEVVGRAAMIVDALNEASLLYTGGGSDNCGQPIRLAASQAYQLVSVPWTDQGGDRIRAVYPGGVMGGDGTPSTGTKTATGSQFRLGVLGNRAIGPCAAKPIVRVLDVGLSTKMLQDFPRPWLHDPLGPELNGALRH
jgi:hypothetical protein